MNGWPQSARSPGPADQKNSPPWGSRGACPEALEGRAPSSHTAALSHEPGTSEIAELGAPAPRIDNRWTPPYAPSPVRATPCTIFCAVNTQFAKFTYSAPKRGTRNRPSRRIVRRKSFTALAFGAEGCETCRDWRGHFAGRCTPVWPRMGPRLVARGVSPWYAGAITLEYNAALNRAEVPLPGRAGENRSRRCW